VFLAADSERPRKLERSGFGVPESRFTYAIGRLVLLAPGEDPDAGYLSRHAGRIAIANPSTAPYGQAAMEVLKALDADSYSLVVGTNVLQAFQFVDSGSVAAGLVALSHVRINPRFTPSDYWIIPQHYYTPIRQQGILLKTGNPEAMQLLNFLRSEDAARIIVDDGYAVATGE
jgi:molybdate transport system substrate-binding protein